MFNVTKLFQTIITSLMALMLLLAVAPVSADNKERLFAAWELWYPYQFNNEVGELAGVDIEFFNAVMMEANLNYSIDEVAWTQQLSMLKEGQIDVAMGVSKTPARESFAHFSIPYRQERVHLFVKKGNVSNYQLPTLASLAGTKLKIGTEQGYYYGDLFDQLSDDPNFTARFHEVVGVEENIRMVLNGKLDGLLADPNTMRATLDRLQLTGKFEAHPLSIYSTDIHFMFSKRSVPEKTVKIINDAIVALQRNGKAQALLGI